MTRIRGGLIGIVAVLAAAAPAAASLPSAGLIVPGKSIGTVHLGSTFAAAKKAWGSSGKCATTKGLHYCAYAGRATTAGRATFGATGSTISSVSLTAGYDPTTKQFVTSTPLARFHTAKGIHIGSTAAAVTRAYPKLISVSSGAELELRATGNRTTYFLVFDGSVYSITMNIAGA